MTELDELPDAVPSTTETTSTAQSSAKPTSIKQKKTATKNQTLSEFFIRKPDWSYIHLQHISTSNASSTQALLLDGVTAQLHLNAALSTFLGLHGSAIPIDLLQLKDQDVWIRVPADDRAALIAAAGGWTSKNGDYGWRVKGWSHWNASALGRDAGQDLFNT